MTVLVLTATLTQLSQGRRHGKHHRVGHHRSSNDEGEGHHRGQDVSWAAKWRDRLRHGGRHHSFNFFNSDKADDPFMSFDLLWGGKAEGQAPWWTGPHVCESESEEKTSANNETGPHIFFRHYSHTARTCDETETAYKCKETTQTPMGKREVTVVRECCHGYTRQQGDLGCPSKLELKNLYDKAEELGLTDFVRAVKMLQLQREIQEGNFTVFAPVNGAFGLDSELLGSDNNILISDEPHVVVMSKPGAERAIEHLQDAMLGHLVMGSLRSSSMEDEQVLETANPVGSTIRINHFVAPQKVSTANCVPLQSTDHMASNGIIHTLTRAMRPVTKSFLDIVKSSPELSTLKTVLASANYVSRLDEEGRMTLLAPTNRAFEKLDARLRGRLMRGDQKCIEKVLENHLLPNVICTAALKGQAKTVNFLHRYVNLTKTEKGKIFANDAQMVQTDMMATNGVIHIIDEVLVPPEALNILDVLQREGFTQLLDLLDKAQLTKTLDTSENITLFAPSNEAIEQIPEAVKSRLVSSPAMLLKTLKYHVTPSVRACGRFHDNELIPSLEGSDIRLNTFHTFNAFSSLQHTGVRTAQCVPLTHRRMEACNGRITVLEDMMMPPKGNVIDVLALDKKFSTLVSLIKRSGLADSLQDDGPFTIFAPNNAAFEKIDRRTLDDLASDGDRLRKLLKKHVFGNNLCCAGIFKSSWFGKPQVRTMSDDLLTLDRKHDWTPTIEGARVVKCDQTATNGNVLEIDSVLLDRERERHHGGYRHKPWWDRVGFGFEP